MKPTASDGQGAAWLAPCAIVSIIALSLWSSGPAPIGAPASETEYSTERALRHLRVIAAEPHATGTGANYQVHDYVREQLEHLGVEIHDVGMLSQRRGNSTLIRNIAARIRGTDSTGAVLVGAHYDSVPQAPGAGDNGAAVASALETIRALRAGPSLRNDVIFLFTDGEELGLLGAEVFVRSHPWRDDVGLALNFDARGNAGPLLMYETSAGAGELVRRYAATAPHPIAGSVMADIYDKMPNLTDFTVYSRAGYPGLNFAFIGGYQAYHDPSDSVENLDPSTLAHQGTTMLSLVRGFGDTDLPLPADQHVVYFNPVGSWMVLYPAALVWPLTLAGMALFVITVWLGIRAQRVRAGSLPVAIVLFALGTVGSTLLAAGMTAGALLAVYGEWWIVGNTKSDALFFVAITLVTTAVICAAFRNASRWLSHDELTVGAAAGWCALLVAASVWLPGGSGLVLWAMAPCLLALCSGYLVTARRPNAPRVGVYLACAAVMLAVMAPLVHLFYQAMMLSLCVVAVPLVALTVGLLWPVLHRVAGRLSAISAGLAAASWIAGYVLAG